MPSLVAHGISLYYEQRGTGRPLLFFNGSGATLAGSEFLLQVFAQTCEVTAHDQRGLGRTDIPPGPYTMADYANDAAALLSVLGIKECAVVGISFGGMVAQEFAVRFPHVVTRLALMCTSAGGDGGASYPLHELADLAPTERAELGMHLLDTRFSTAWLAEHPSDQFLVDSMANRASNSLSSEQMRGTAEQLRARSRHDVFDRLPAINVPTFVAGGRYDGIAPPANSEAIAAQIDGATLRLYEGGHAFFAQDRAAFPDILDFLGE